MLACHEAQMETTTLPKFRLCWLSPDKRDEMRRMLLQEAVALEQQQHQGPVEMTNDDTARSDDSDEFFVFESDTSITSDSTAYDEVRKYLEDSDSSIKSLQAFPIIKQLFIKNNTTVPSSAPVEPLFSLRGRILTPSQNRMTVIHMEQVLLLRYNKRHNTDVTQ